MQLMDGALARTRDADNASYLHIAVGTVLDRSARYDRAFGHFVAGKKLRKAALRYDPNVLSAEIDATIRLFDDGFFDRRVGFGATSDAPVFVIRLPRSGSTLVERILARHSKIEAAGELPIVFRLVDEL